MAGSTSTWGRVPNVRWATATASTSCFQNERGVLARKGHPLRAARSMKELLDAEWIVTGLRELLEQEFEEQFLNTLAPLSKSCSAMALPMPLAPPVTSAVFPARSYEFGTCVSDRRQGN